MPDSLIELVTGSLGALCKISNFMIFKTLLLSQFSSDIVALWNFNMEVNGKILKCTISWKWLIVEFDGWKVGELRSYVLCYVGYFLCRILWVQFRSFGALWKIPDVNIFKRLLLPQFLFSFKQTLEKACNPGKYRPLLFLVIGQILNICHFEEKLPQLHCYYLYG